MSQKYGLWTIIGLRTYALTKETRYAQSKKAGY